ncbi:FecR family protein [Novosphingobium sp. RL4]|uniref:FecR family protein n=1 Tax=Novosphingobium sp. RL4 TaxID=3109595 RepID=UPI002D78B187|nr:FecR domain-containing protein [Novosphingobium sp. RL4]WRT94454.1 FecR domain-containing protein [Novosphingobium sp. RL4]
MSFEEEVDDWFARMRGPEAERFREAFADWYAEPQNAAAYERRVRSWDTIKFITNTPTGRRRRLAIAKPALLRTPGKLVGALAVCGLLIGTVAFVGGHRWSAGRQLYSRMEVASLEEQPRKLVLPDSSAITLDRGARIQISFDASQRRLRLLAGRARFAVAHEVDRPFVVEAGEGSVTAHGTLFDVELLPARMNVSLIQGAVEVQSRTQVSAVRGLDLMAGQRVTIAGGVLGVPTSTPPIDRAWPNDMLVLDGADLADAVAAFNRTTPVPVLLEFEAARPMRVTGAFRRSDPEGFARQLAATFDLAVRVRLDGSFALVDGEAEKK